VVSAAHDPIAPPRFGRQLAGLIPDARYVEFAEASHGLTIQHAAELNRLLADWVNSRDTEQPRITKGA
jgi:pimeloyl-ACP methyl ester carboxylesterase